MDYMKEIADAIEASNKSLDGFKGEIVERLNFLEGTYAKKTRPHLGGGYADDYSTDSTAHRKAFNSYLRKGDITELKQLEIKTPLQISTGPDGGYAVPKVIDSMIDDLAVNVSPIRAIAQIVQISSPDFHKLVNLHGTASGWVGETAARIATATPQLVDINPPMGELYANPQATQQMLDDVFFNADGWLAGEIALEFARAEGAAFVNGTGVTQPKGFLTGATAATSDATRAFGTLEYMATGTSGAFKTLTATVNPVDDLYALVGKLKAQYRKDAVFVMSKSTLFAIMGMKDYQGRYVFNPAIAPGMSDTILGYPVFEAEDMAAIGANSLSIAFGNFKAGYLIVDRVGTRVVRDPFSNKPYVSFYATKRVGGALLNSEAIKLLKFSAS